MEKPLLSSAHEESSLFLCGVSYLCQYAAVATAAVDVAMAKVIAAEVIICYLGMLCKWKTAVLAWLSVFQVQYGVFIDE